MELIITTLAANAIAVLTPYVKSGAEKFASEIGKDAAEKAKNLLNTLKTRFSGDKIAEWNLDHFEKEPDKYKSTLEDVLKEKLDKDKSLVDELNKLLKDMGPTLKVVQKMKEAEEVTGLEAQEMSEGTAEVAQEFDQGKKITGMKFGSIGKSADKHDSDKI
jgi:vacuolar-type H+-ATPase subunit I/STV1